MPKQEKIDEWQQLEQQLNAEVKQQIRERGMTPYFRPQEGENKLKLVTTQLPQKDPTSDRNKYLIKVINLEDNQEYLLSVSPPLLQKIVALYNRTKNPNFTLIRAGTGQLTRYSVKQ